MLHQLIRETLNLPGSYPIHDEIRLVELPGWDSLGWVGIINLIESRMQMELPLNELAEVTTIRALRQLVESQSLS